MRCNVWHLHPVDIIVSAYHVVESVLPVHCHKWHSIIIVKQKSTISIYSFLHFRCISILNDCLKHSLQASIGIRILAPIRIVGNPSVFTSSYAFGRLIPICADNSYTLIVVFSITIPPILNIGVSVSPQCSFNTTALGRLPISAVSTDLRSGNGMKFSRCDFKNLLYCFVKNFVVFKSILVYNVTEV